MQSSSVCWSMGALFVLCSCSSLSCWLHLHRTCVHRACAQVFLTTFTQSMWPGITDHIYTEHVARSCWQHLHRACGLNDCIYTEHGVRCCWSHLHRAWGQVLLITFTQSMWSGLADCIHTDQSGQVLHGVLRSCWPHSHRAVWSDIANHVHTEQCGQVLLTTFIQSSLVMYFWPHSHRAVWSCIADHIHTEQSGQVLLTTFTQSSLVRCC